MPNLEPTIDPGKYGCLITMRQQSINPEDLLTSRMAFLRRKRIELRVIQTFTVNMFSTANSRQGSSMIAILKTLFRTNPLAIGNLFAMKNGNLI
jgi:hypothetical protein